jgi:hypothetical protein
MTAAVVSDAPEIAALDEAARAVAESVDQKAVSEALVEPMARVIDRLGAGAVEGWLRARGKQHQAPFPEAFRCASQRLQRTLWQRQIRADVVFAPVLFRGEDESRFVSEIDRFTSAAIVQAMLASMPEEARGRVMVVPFSTLYTEHELRTNSPEFFHRALRTVFATCVANGEGKPPKILVISNRKGPDGSDHTDLQSRRPLTQHLYDDGQARPPKVALRFLPLAVLRDADQPLPSVLADIAWRMRAGDEITYYANRQPSKSAETPARKMPLPPSTQTSSLVLPPRRGVRIDVMAPCAQNQAIAAGRTALTLEVLALDAAYWLAAERVACQAKLVFHADSGKLLITYQRPHSRSGRSMAVEVAAQLREGHAGWLAAHRLRDELVAIGFASVELTTREQDTLAWPGQTEAPRTLQ